MKPTPKTARKRGTTASGLAMLLALLVVAAACGEGDEATGDSLTGSSWEMTSVWEGNTMVAANPTAIGTMVFADGTATGFTGCNSYQAAYTAGGTSISFGDPVLPGSACDPAYTGQGDAFIRAMQASDRFVVSDGSLELTDATGAAQLQFRPAEELPLAGVAWRLAWYGGGSSPLDGTQISLAFGADGTLTGIAGCNDYFADYQIDGNHLVIGDVAHTEMACMEPDGVMAQETDYLEAIRQVDGFVTTLTGLELLDPDGNPIAEYRFGGRIR